MSRAVTAGIGAGGRGAADGVGGASGKWCRVWAAGSAAGGVWEGCDLAPPCSLSGLLLPPL